MFKQYNFKGLNMSYILPNTPPKVSIEGEPLHSFKSLRLSQAINEHHVFEILMDHEVGELPGTHSMGKSADWLGKKLSIFWGDKRFVGIIAQVGVQRSEGISYLRIAGYSMTYLLESDAHFASWNEKTLEHIVGELTQKSGVQALIKPEKIGVLEYECQYQESNFGFIQRLAKQHFEWLYYDGESLVFGKPELESAIPLDSQEHLQALDICIQTGAKPLSTYSHQSGANNTLTANSPDEPAGLNGLGSRAFDASIALFGTPSNHYALARASSKSELDTYLQKKQQADAAMSHYIRAESDYIGLGLGSVVDIKSSIKVLGNSFAEEAIGAYFITEITHYMNGDDNTYHCQFVGLPTSIKTLPSPNVPLPLAQPQMATVISNEDPKGQGRVQVKMNWQVDGMKSPWMRVLSPDAGGSDKVSSNRGFVFIPEEGDQVMVAFRYNDPNRPYIQGSLFNGTNAGGGGEGNKTKSLTTRSGATVSLDDSVGSITLKDPNGNKVFLDGSKNIEITAVSSISLSVGGSQLSLDAEGNITLSATNITLLASGELNTSGATITSTATAAHAIEGSSVSVSGKESVSVSGTMKTDIDSMGTTSVSGTIVKLN